MDLIQDRVIPQFWIRKDYQSLLRHNYPTNCVKALAYLHRSKEMASCLTDGRRSQKNSDAADRADLGGSDGFPFSRTLNSLPMLTVTNHSGGDWKQLRDTGTSSILRGSFK